jgi:sulfatase maturation enzyme AslB (radical SAM superfamily)
MTNMRNELDSHDKHDFVETCFRCFNEEKLGSLSLRERYPFKVKETKIEMLELLFSNICNFKCLTCNSSLSTSWMGDDTKLFANGFSDRSPVAKSEISKVNYDGIDSLKLLKITGGEPFLYKGLQENLELVLEKNRDCSLWIYTNGSIYPKDMIKTIKKFKDVNIAISVDGYGHVNEYIRYGSNWKQVEENIRLFKETGARVFLTTVVSAYSLPRLKKLIDWWGTGGRHIFIYLQKPYYISLNVLPQEMLSKAITDLSSYDLPFMSILKNVKSQHHNEFELYTSILDNLRGNDYESIK